MKSRLIALAWLGALVLHAEAAKPPSGVYTMDNAPEAEAKARESNLPLLYMTGLLESSCPKVRDSVTRTHDMFRAFKQNAVIIYLAPHRSWRKLPSCSPPILGAFVSKRFSDKPPQMVFVSPDRSKVYTIFGDNDVANKSKVREIKEKVAKIHNGEIPADEFPSTDWGWEAADAKYGGFRGEFTKLEGDRYLHLRNAGGKIIRIDGDTLAPHHLEFARNLSRGETAPAPEPEMMEWVGSNGKAIKATFVSLESDDLTLKLESGKTTTVKTSRLTEASARQAETCASNGTKIPD